MSVRRCVCKETDWICSAVRVLSLLVSLAVVLLIVRLPHMKYSAGETVSLWNFFFPPSIHSPLSETGATIEP